MHAVWCCCCFIPNQYTLRLLFTHFCLKTLWSTMDHITLLRRIYLTNVRNNSSDAFVNLQTYLTIRQMHLFTYKRAWRFVRCICLLTNTLDDSSDAFVYLQTCLTIRQTHLSTYKRTWQFARCICPLTNALNHLILYDCPLTNTLGDLPDAFVYYGSDLFLQ